MENIFGRSSPEAATVEAPDNLRTACQLIAAGPVEEKNIKNKEGRKNPVINRLKIGQQSQPWDGEGGGNNVSRFHYLNFQRGIWFVFPYPIKSSWVSNKPSDDNSI